MTQQPAIAIREVAEGVATWNPLRSPASDSFEYIDLGSVDQNNKQIRQTTLTRCSEAPSRARQLVKSADVLVATVRPNLNGVALVPDSLDGATASTGFCVLRPLPEKIDNRYLFNWVKSPAFITDMVRKATGASYPAVSDRIVLDSLIPFPPLPAQRRIAYILDKADALRAQRRAALAELDSLTQSIFLTLFGDLVTNRKGWPETKTLGDVADIASGITKGRLLKGQATREVAYLAVSNVQDKALSMGVVKTIAATEAEITRFRLQKDDLLLTEGGDPDKLGRGTLWNGELDECIHQNHVFRVRVTDKAVDPLFLNWLVGSRRGKQYFLRSAKQTTGIASINMTQLRAFPLLLPPLKLQQDFARRITAIETLKSRHRSALAELDTLFASLQHRAFRGEL